MSVEDKEERRSEAEETEPQRDLFAGSVATENEIEDSPCQTLGYPIPCLPEDIWRHIHSLMPMDAAARAACLSHAFLSSWRSYPKLTLSRQTLCSKTSGNNLSSRIDSILKKHSGIGLKILSLTVSDNYSCFPYINSWLQAAVTPGIEELTLTLHGKYNFPCSLLSDGVRSSIRSLQLSSCVFCPTRDLGPFRRLTIIRMRSVHITGDELECLLSNSFALEHLYLNNCKGIVFLKIPSVLERLSSLKVFVCSGLQVIENNAPNLSSFTLIGKVSELSLGEASQIMKVFCMRHANVVCYARTELPPIMPNLETLELDSSEEVDTPMLPTKFLNLKHLFIQISGWTLSPSYDYFSLVSFLDASPSLETWYLNVSQKDMKHESVFGGSSFRQLPEQRHNHLKSVEIVGFSSAKGLVELTCCIVKNVVSLERLTLNTLHGHGRCSGENNNDCGDQICVGISKAVLKEATTAVAAIRKYIEDKVAPTTKLTVLEPCTRCHSTTVDDGR